ncbi:MAG: hypothetical protein PVF47_17800, partial [Anaerolineae bacterium]
EPPRPPDAGRAIHFLAFSVLIWYDILGIGSLSRIEMAPLGGFEWMSSLNGDLVKPFKPTFSPTAA